MKQCSACAKEGAGPKPATEFGQSNQTADGLARHCKVHARKFNADHRARNAEKIREEKRAARSKGSSISEALRGWSRPVQAYY